MRTISLRKFRDSVGDLDEEVEVARRDSDGNIVVIGRWVPSVTYPPNAVPLKETPPDTGHPQYKTDHKYDPSDGGHVTPFSIDRTKFGLPPTDTR